MKKKLGLIVNPIAGVGGSVGLKGTDGSEVLKKAFELGGVKLSPQKAIKALLEIKERTTNIDIITYPGEMGEFEALQAGIKPIVIGKIGSKVTTAQDTENAAKDMLKENVDLIVFAGGDGTARNIYNVVGHKIPVIGIPTGVKIHSAIFGTNPVNAGIIAADFISEKIKNVKLCEVMDIDEEEFRKGRVVAKLFGYMNVPYESKLVQSLKCGGISTNEENIIEIADFIIENMEDDYLYIIGPGTTTAKIMERLGLKNTLLGVDVVYKKKLLANDVNEKQLLEIVDRKKFKIIISIIGGQGYIFGRGNQQISTNVIKKVSKEDIIVIASPEKILSLNGRTLLVDTGDESLDEKLKGYYRIVVGYRKTYVYKCQ